MKTLLVTLLTLITAAQVIVVRASTDQSPEKKVRVVQRRPDVALRALLKPGDEVVVVEDGVHEIPLTLAPGTEPTFADEMQSLRGDGMTVFVGHVANSESLLARNDEWIISRAEIQVEDVVRPGNRPLVGRHGNVQFSEGGRVLSIEQDGGERVIEGTVVRAGDFAVWRPGSRYLIGMQIVPEDRQTYLSWVLLIRKDGTLGPQERSSSSSTNGTRSALEGKKLSEILRSLRAQK